MTSTLPRPAARLWLPARLILAMAEFTQDEPMMAIWERYPHVSEERNETTDWWACEKASRRFVDLAAGHGLSPRLVYASEAEHPWADRHWWVRIDHRETTINIDFTARQYHNLENPPRPVHANLPCPLVWASGPDALPADTHPVVGRFRTVCEAAEMDGPAH